MHTMKLVLTTATFATATGFAAWMEYVTKVGGFLVMLLGLITGIFGLLLGMYRWRHRKDIFFRKD